MALEVPARGVAGRGTSTEPVVGRAKTFWGSGRTGGVWWGSVAVGRGVVAGGQIRGRSATAAGVRAPEPACAMAMVNACGASRKGPSCTARSGGVGFVRGWGGGEGAVGAEILHAGGRGLLAMRGAGGRPSGAPRARPRQAAEPRGPPASHRRPSMSHRASNSAQSPTGERGRCLHFAGFASAADTCWPRMASSGTAGRTRQAFGERACRS